MKNIPDIFGSYIKNKRLKLGYSRKEFCEKFGYDPYYHAKMEMGIVEPYCSFKFGEKLSKDLGLDKVEKQEFMLAFIETVKSPDPYSVPKIISFLIGNAYAEWCSMDKKTRVSWIQQLSLIQAELSQIAESFKSELVANILREGNQ